MKQGNIFRLYPTKEQEIALAQHFGACRFVYNELLSIKKEMYSKFGSSPTKKQLSKYITVLKHTYRDWLKDVNSQALQAARDNLFTAFKNMYEHGRGYPQFKSRNDPTQSFQVTQHYKINLTNSKIFFPKIGWVKVVLHRDFLTPEIMDNCITYTDLNGDRIIEKDLNKDFFRTATVSRKSSGTYHVSILTEDGTKAPEKVEYSDDTTIGIDLGLKEFAILSNGEKIENPKHLQNSEKRLKTLQRRVSRKKKGSQNRKKAARKLARQHEKIANQRTDFQHKVSSKIVCESQAAIAVETLNVKGMLKNHKLAKAISSVSWSSFVLKLEYKAERAGKTILKIGMFEPSTKTCNVCGSHNSEITLEVREWECPDCKTFHDRDINAAINIKKFALAN